MKSFHPLIVLLAISLVGCQSRHPASIPGDDAPKPATAQQHEVHTAAAPAGEEMAPDFTEQDLDRIEAELKIKLPAEYRNFMPARSKEIFGHTYPLRGKTELWLEGNFFDVERLISENLSQRGTAWAAAVAFPGWWKEYLLFGTNGGGDYYALKLDGSPGVWFLDCDGGQLKRYADSLEDYLAKSLEDFPKELEKYQRLEQVWQQKIKGEIDDAEFERKWQAILDEP